MYVDKFDPFWSKYLMFLLIFQDFGGFLTIFFKSMRFSMRFTGKVWEVWDSDKKYDLLPKVWDVEGVRQIEQW